MPATNSETANRHFMPARIPKKITGALENQPKLRARVAELALLNRCTMAPFRDIERQFQVVTRNSLRKRWLEEWKFEEDSCR